MVPLRTCGVKVQKARGVSPVILILALSNSKKYGQGRMVVFVRSIVRTVTSIEASLDVAGLVC